MTYRWRLILFTSPDKHEIIKSIPARTMSDIAYLLGETTQRVSNLYHGMLKPVGALRMCEIHRY